MAIHAVLLLALLDAARRVARVYLRDESLVFLVPPQPARARPPSAPSASATASASDSASASNPFSKKRNAPPDTQLITLPAPAQPPPAEKTLPPVDWQAQADFAITHQAALALATQPRALDRHGVGADLNGGLGPDKKPQAEFGWDSSHTHRVEAVEGGGVLIHINERCVLVLFPLPFAGCGIGKIPVRGDLLDHMHDAPEFEAGAKNTAP